VPKPKTVRRPAKVTPKPRTPRVRNYQTAGTPDGGVFIRIRDSGIDPLILTIDGLSVFTFTETKSLYLRMEDVIAWYEKEASLTRSGRGPQLLAAAAKFRRDLASIRNPTPAELPHPTEA